MPRPASSCDGIGLCGASWTSCTPCQRRGVTSRLHPPQPRSPRKWWRHRALGRAPDDPAGRCDPRPRRGYGAIGHKALRTLRANYRCAPRTLRRQLPQHSWPGRSSHSPGFAAHSFCLRQSRPAPALQGAGRSAPGVPYTAENRSAWPYLFTRGQTRLNTYLRSLRKLAAEDEYIRLLPGFVPPKRCRTFSTRPTSACCPIGRSPPQGRRCWRCLSACR